MRIRILPAVFLLLTLSALLPAQTKPDALKAYREGRYNDAVTICLDEIAADPSNVESHVVLSWALVEAKRYEEAENWAKKGHALSKYDPRLIEILAEAHYYLGNNQQSLRLFQEYISYAPNGSRISLVYYFMGEIYLRLAKYRHADMAFSAALQLESMNARWWTRLGYSREMAKEYRYALEAYHSALKLDPNEQDAIRGRDRTQNQLH